MQATSLVSGVKLVGGVILGLLALIYIWVSRIEHLMR